MRPIPVAHVINGFGLGGVPQVAYQLMASLPAGVYRPYLYLLKHYDLEGDMRPAQAQRFQELGVTVRCPVRDDKKFYVVGEMCRWLRADGIKLLHTHSYKPNLYGRLAGSLSRQDGVRTIAHYHNTYDNKWAEDDSLIYEELLARQTDHFIACSESVRNHVVERVGVEAGRVRVVYNGIDLERFQPREDRDQLRQELGIKAHQTAIGLVGRICRQKAQDDLLKAAALLRDQFPNAVFLLAGAPDEPEQLECLQQLAQELRLGERVRFMGYVADIPRVYGTLDILAMPSRWEGFGLALAEAMAMGLPIVTTPAGGIPEVVGDAALMVPPDEPERLAEALTTLLNDPQRARTLGEAGRARAQRFSFERMGHDVDALYRDLMKQASP